MDIKSTSTQKSDSIQFSDFFDKLGRHIEKEADGFLSFLEDNIKTPLEQKLEDFLNSPLPTFFSGKDVAKNEAPKEFVKPPSLALNPHAVELSVRPHSLLLGSKTFTEKTFNILPSQPGFPHGQLDQTSKNEVNKLIWNLSEKLNVEVHASVANTSQGPQVRVTAGYQGGVNYSIPANTVYSAHTHLSGILRASPTDLRNNVPNVEDAVVVRNNSLVYA